MGEWVDRWMDGWVGEWVSRWMGGWVGGWMGGWLENKFILIFISVSIFQKLSTLNSSYLEIF